MPTPPSGRFSRTARSRRCTAQPAAPSRRSQGCAPRAPLAQLQPAIAAHAAKSAIWSRTNEDHPHVPWRDSECLAAASHDLLAAAPAGAWASPDAAFTWYTSGGWMVHRAGEELLRNLGEPDPALIALLNPLRAAYRAMWEQQLAIPN